MDRLLGDKGWLAGCPVGLQGYVSEIGRFFGLTVEMAFIGRRGKTAARMLRPMA
jgi:hypothetical protein